MFESLILQFKKTFTMENGESIVNFLSSKIRSVIYYIAPEKVLVTKERHILRPDIISIEASGTMNNWEVLYKYNQISNPFSVNIGEHILVPDIQTLKDNIVPIEIKDKNEILDDNDFRKALIEKNQGRLDYEEKLKKFNNKFNFSKYNLPPNVAEPGDKEVSLDENGMIIAGNNI